MPFYAGLRRLKPIEQARAIDGLLKLKQQLCDDGVPAKNVDDTLLLGTWNIREFDSGKYGARCAESYYYIAEVISHFDLVAVQEVRGDLEALERLLGLLGRWWKYIVTDVTLGTAGNDERLAFLYDSRKVAFDGLAGELVLPSTSKNPVLQFARSPFICGFKAGWTHFKLCTVHIYYGTSTPVDARRVAEIRDLAQTLAAIARGGKRELRSSVGERPQTRRLEAENLILLGDFNVFNRADATFTELTRAGFTVPPELQAHAGSDLKSTKHYDQIAFMARPGRFGTSGRAGVFDFQKSVFGRDQLDRYRDLVDPAYFISKNGKAKNPTTVYNDWRTHQMSDHLLLWSELRINFSEEYLREMAAPVVM
jgi:endonuclease/exonuclease/phosphatase family metal-dependent hydrolase